MPVRVTVSPTWDRWVAGFGHLEAEMNATALRTFTQANEVFFDRSQANAHVLSGENRASGSASVHAVVGEILARVQYDSDHAIYEEARGGSHAFIGRAWEQTEVMFRGALPEAWGKVVSSWR